MTEYLDPRTVARLLDEAAGRWLTVTFEKRTTGEVRRMTCRTGVRKGATGAGMRFDPSARALRVVWAADAAGYRMVPLDAVTEVRSRGLRTFVCRDCGCETTLASDDTGSSCLACWYDGRRDIDADVPEVA
ncbi:MAG TPA: hypothetical protein VJP77_05500 [Planctomycetota bacterium]|nr:hypothetical protein [Planctomycetota bacterium]